MFNLKIVYGKAKSFPLTIRDTSGVLVNLDSKTVRFSVKGDTDEADPALITKTTGSGIVHSPTQSGVGMGLAILTILPADTTGLAPGLNVEDEVLSLVAEIEIIQSGSNPEIMDSGFLTVQPAVRRSV